MLSLQLTTDIGQDPNFQGRAVMAFNLVAHEVLLEPDDTLNHILRANHANAILQRPSSKIVEYLGGVVASASIQNSGATTVADITDDQILEGVRQVWDSLIGIVRGG